MKRQSRYTDSRQGSSKKTSKKNWSRFTVKEQGGATVETRFSSLGEKKVEMKKKKKETDG